MGSKSYPGKGITVSYDAGRCIHAAECVKGLPRVFDPQRKPWIDPSRAEADEVAAVVPRCPTGALHFTRQDGGPEESVPAANTVTVAPDGPLYLHGNIRVQDMEGRTLLQDTRVALCRCGASGNRPLCDGSHTKVGFQDSGNELKQWLKGEGDGQGPLQVTVVKDGPFTLEGPLSLIGADGSAARGGRGALCRCGASGNKPFCDGSHSRVGFKAG